MTTVVDWLTLFVTFSTAIMVGTAGLIAYKSQKEQREHNILSVAPHLTIDYCLIPSQGLKVSVTNNGLGPAIIISCKVFHKDVNVLAERTELGEWEIIGHSSPVDIHYDTWMLTPDEAVTPGKKIDLISLDRRSSKENAIVEFHSFTKFIKSLRFEIEYESFYKDKQLIEVWDGSKQIPDPNTIRF